MYLLDTNVLSELRQGRPSRSQNVRTWASGVPIGQQFISAISLMELEIGVLRLERRTPPEGGALRAWLGGVRRVFAGRVLAVDEVVALRCAQLHVPDPAPERDAMIAATALTHGFTVVTRNVGDFKGTGIKLINPWQSVQ
jgi:predicted nucleic acid-binding protein